MPDFDNLFTLMTLDNSPTADETLNGTEEPTEAVQIDNANMNASVESGMQENNAEVINDRYIRVSLSVTYDINCIIYNQP